MFLPVCQKAMHKLLRSIKLVRIISDDVYRAAAGERLLYGFLVVSLLFMLLAAVPFRMNPEQVRRVAASPTVFALEIGFSGMNIFLMLMSVFIALNVLQHGFKDVHLMALVSKPVQRWHIIEGTFLGLFKIVFVNWVIMVASLMLILYLNAHRLYASVFIGTSVSLVLVLIYLSLALFFFALLPNAMSGVLAFFVIIAGFGASLGRDYFLGLPAPIKFFSDIGLAIIPKINHLFGISMDLLGIFDLSIDSLPIFAHTLVLIVVIHAFGCYKLSRPR